MDKNALEDTKFVFLGSGWNIMGLLISIALAGTAKEFTDINPILAFFITLASVVIAVHITNEIRWAVKRKNGLINIKGFSDDRSDETEKFAGIEFSPKNELEKIKLQVICRRATIGREIGLSNLLFDNTVYIAKDVIVEDYPKKIPVISILEDYPYLLSENNAKTSLRILLDEKTNFSQEKCEMFFEIRGKINEKYVFSEFYRGVILYGCSTDPNMLVGQEQVLHRSSQIKWEYLDKRSLEEENKRPLLREIRNIADRMP